MMENEKSKSWGGKDSPCLGCTARRPGCHGIDPDGEYICRRYEKFKLVMEKERQCRNRFVDGEEALKDTRKRLSKAKK